ncbi:MAG TPA: Tim44-like domain-containing protein, partial [Myxococcaceae bacterium]|nr:Tim44-like domain-containing protein [Myxococcaceae bacterium]
MRIWLYRLARLGPWLLVLLPVVAWARGGGGENYNSGQRERSRGNGNGDGGGEGLGYLLYFVVRLTLQHPMVMCPLITIAGLAYYFWQKSNDPTATTQRAFQQREAELRTQVSARDVEGWVNALKLKDPQFELLPLLDKVKTLFVQLQDAWFRRDLTPVRPFLSDATFQRFNVQLKLMQAQGVRDAIADTQVLDIQIIGLDQSPWFDSVHVRVKAQMRDTDVLASTSDEQALAAARRVPLEPFTEVWTFVRKPGTQTKIGADLFQGKCPNCGAPFRGGSANSCEFCGAVVNSGNYDWTLSEITQGIEHIRHYATVDGLMQAREADPALNLEILEDRASLVFWKWIDAQSTGDARRLSKLALPGFSKQLQAELEGLAKQGRRKVFLQCAVGGVITRQLNRRDGYDHADVEIRWSARMGVGPVDQKPPELPNIPQRWVFTLVRQEGAQTRVENGMS